MRYIRNSVYVISVKPVAELAYPCSDLRDVSTRAKRDWYAILGAPCQIV